MWGEAVKYSDKEIFERLMSVSIRKQKAYKYLKAWDTKKTLIENAMAAGMRTAAARTIANKMALGYKKLHHRHYGQAHKTNIRDEAFCVLREAGWSYANIGALFAVSRQCIEQRVNRRGKR